jgi:aconitate hydratase
MLLLAGKEYGTGSSRDWAAKGPLLLGVKAVLAESFERIHRSNLVGMGVLPLTFEPGESVESLGLSGRESYEIDGMDSLEVGKKLNVRIFDGECSLKEFAVRACINSEAELAARFRKKSDREAGKTVEQIPGFLKNPGITAGSIRNNSLLHKNCGVKI